jgi:long-chain acyl-CoA synthetase
MSGAVFLTGGTGFLGMELIARLLERADGPDVFVAVRAGDDAEAHHRIDELLARLYETPPESSRRLHPVRADLTAEGMGLSAEDRRLVTESVDRVIHCAASISFTLPLDEARRINVDGTRAVLDLAREVQGLKRLVHVSTAYVAGRAAGPFHETDLEGHDFRNTYEQTKLEAELLVAEAAADLPVAVVRPSIVVGESDSGWTAAFNVIYWPLQAFARGLFDEIPADADAIVDLVPVDYVTEVIERAAFQPGATGTFNAVAAGEALTVGELVEAIGRELDARPPRLTDGTLPADHPGAMFAPYFDVQTAFDDRRARALMGDSAAPSPSSYLPVMLQYAQRARWGKRNLSRQAARAIAEVPA